MRRAMLVTLSLLLLAQAPKTPQQIFGEGRAAYEKKDFSGYLAAMEQLHALRPKHPLVLVNYAGALALNGKGAEAVGQLQLMTAMQIVADLDDHDFDAIRGQDEFRAVAARMQAIRTEVVGTPEIAYRLPKGLETESITYDPQSGSFFVSAVRKRKILRIDRKGRVTDFVPSASHGLWGGNGMAVDVKRRLLWTTSSAYDRIEGFTKGGPSESALYAFNADTGAFVARYEAPAAGGPHMFDDMTAGGDGTLYVSDSTGMMFRLAPGAKALEPFVARNVMRSPQGCTVSPNGRLLYVSDYGSGVFAVDLATGDAVKVVLPDDFPAYGIDGLAIHGRTLFAVQNGVAPNRAVRIELAPDGLHATGWRVLAMNQPLMDEPTIGVVARGAYYFLGASQGNKFDVDPPKLDALHEAPVYRIGL
jgi:sugar lactone lactonase YvrE